MIIKSFPYYDGTLQTIAQNDEIVPNTDIIPGTLNFYSFISLEIRNKLHEDVLVRAHEEGYVFT